MIFDKVSNPIWDYLYAFGWNLIIVNSQILKKQFAHLVTLSQSRNNYKMVRPFLHPFLLFSKHFAENLSIFGRIRSSNVRVEGELADRWATITSYDVVGDDVRLTKAMTLLVTLLVTCGLVARVPYLVLRQWVRILVKCTFFIVQKLLF